MMSLTVERIWELQKAYAKKEEEGDESLQARYYARPLSYRLAWLFLKFGFSANNITALAFLIGISGCVCMGFGTDGCVVLGAVLLNVRHLLDYTDGTVARATNTATNFGGYFDRTCDEIIALFIPISIGMGLYISNCTFLNLSPLAYLILGFSYAVIYSISALSILHIQLIYKVVPRKFYAMRQRGIWWLIYKVGINLESVATLILLPLAFFSNGLPSYLIGFTLLTICKLLFGIYIRIVDRCE